MIPPDQEIYEVEKRIAERRHRVESAARDTGRAAMRALTSPGAIIGAAVLGFLVAGGIGHRSQPTAPQMDPQTKKAAKFAGLGSIAMTAATWFIKSQFGSPMALAQFVLSKLPARQQRAAPLQPIPASATMRTSPLGDRPTVTIRR